MYYEPHIVREPGGIYLLKMTKCLVVICWIGLLSGIPESQVLMLGSGGTGSYGYLNMGTPRLRKSRSTILLKHKTAHIFRIYRVVYCSVVCVKYVCSVYVLMHLVSHCNI